MGRRKKSRFENGFHLANTKGVMVHEQTSINGDETRTYTNILSRLKLSFWSERALLYTCKNNCTDSEGF